MRNIHGGGCRELGGHGLPARGQASVTGARQERRGGSAQYVKGLTLTHAGSGS